MFMFQGLPHYYNYVLNRLHGVPGLEIVNVVAVDSSGMGAGVFQTKQDIDFRLYELQEYPVRGGGAFLRSFWRVLIKERPDVLVITPPHCTGFMKNLAARIVRRIFNIKLVLKSIPFRLLSCEEQVSSLRQVIETVSRTPSPFAANVCRGAMRLMRDTGRLNEFLSALHRPIRCFIAGAEKREALRSTLRLYRYPDAHVNYVEEARNLIGGYGVEKSRIFVTYNSPDTDRLLTVYEELKAGGTIAKQPQRMIHVGRLVGWKRVDLLLRALALLKPDFPSADLLIVGDGPERGEWEKLCDDLGLSNSVQFLGNVHDPRDLGTLLMSASLYVLAGMGGVAINDAMCFGLPVVCSVCDGTEKKLVRDGWNGVYFRDGDAVDLYRKLERMLADPAELLCMGQRSLDIIRNDININTVLHGYVQAFEYVTGKKLSS